MESFISSVNKDEYSMGTGKGIKTEKDTVFPDIYICVHRVLTKWNRSVFLKYETAVLI